MEFNVSKYKVRGVRTPKWGLNLALTGQKNDRDSHSRMYWLTFLALLCCSISIHAGPTYSYSGNFGGLGGIPFSHSADQRNGPITAIKVWTNAIYMAGFQVRYGTQWSKPVGVQQGRVDQAFLNPGESIIYVSGTYGLLINRLTFVTDQSRVFSFGPNHGLSFEAYPRYGGAALSYFSGRAALALDSIGLHWDDKPRPQNPPVQRQDQTCHGSSSRQGQTGSSSQSSSSSSRISSSSSRSSSSNNNSG
ncbi:zymogen granule membrane protein 16-like isoform X2 [Sceloporus undulatus]|uniref:zymogen granule membrane protein 16-like isoform X2 n=1 Tax=Sceloporus undulatus TaxID=8520 RepID=UPI001C4B14AA|nr:zymogen granule membrane protein 16-like isoform X2 [Sceloporus undulatus]